MHDIKGDIMIISEKQIMQLINIARNHVEYGRLDKSQKGYFLTVMDLLTQIEEQQSEELKNIK